MTNFHLPPFLNSGDKIGLVATARAIDEPIVKNAEDAIRQAGFEAQRGKHLLDRHFIFSARDEDRIKDINTFIADPNIKAIICCKGGYGTARIIDHLDVDKLRDNPKWICGFSDVTMIHLHLVAHGIASIHSIMPSLFHQEGAKQSVDTLFSCLKGTYPQLQSDTHPLQRRGMAEGVLIGGNLSLLVNSLGTPSEPDFADKILFIEEVDEYLYHIDRMMVQLKRKGILAKLAGLVVGDFSGMKDNPDPFGMNVADIIHSHCLDYNFPIAFGMPIGHEPLNLAVISGAYSRLEVSDEGGMLVQRPHPAQI
ncbi:MAG: LD-carboxypeptidase [Cyclobacteriaceae bacterium]|nr:LD-carboxypeptidase [Cyclobacteriaceae bacterium]MCH8517524.1 LD-carboxypeptidase [Cyclobacteriaceae bacterium]